jgi:hypothetical protein
MDTEDKPHFSAQKRQNELQQKKEKIPQRNKEGERIKIKGLLISILKNGMLYTAFPLFLIYWIFFYFTNDGSQFPKVLIHSLIIFPPLGIITGYVFWLIKNLKKT